MGLPRLVVDAARCDGHGICALRCPELVALDEWGYAAVVEGTAGDTQTLRRARRAVAACPEQALHILVTAPDGAVQGGQTGRDRAERVRRRRAPEQTVAEGAELRSWG